MIPSPIRFPIINPVPPRDNALFDVIFQISGAMIGIDAMIARNRDPTTVTRFKTVPIYFFVSSPVRTPGIAPPRHH